MKTNPPNISDFEIRNSKFEIRNSPAFTLIELLVVISIIGLLVAVALPTVRNFKPDVMAVAVRQLQDDLSYARQRAISDHTTVYVLFVPSCADNNIAPPASLTPADQQRLLKGQYVSYTFYEKRQLGDQPGRPSPQFLTGWKTLPEGITIAQQKFTLANYSGAYTPVLVAGGPTNFWSFQVDTFDCTPENAIPTIARFPYVAFDYRGSLLATNWSAVGDCRIPLTRGTMNFPRDATNGIAWASPNFVERPPGAWSDPNLYTHLVIDGPTGRARPEQRQVQ